VIFGSIDRSVACTESQIAVFAMTEDAKEGRAAFAAKRKPNGTGK
jgi:methylglutaconyl-CoA hydratase